MTSGCVRRCSQLGRSIGHYSPCGVGTGAVGGAWWVVLSFIPPVEAGLLYVLVVSVWVDVPDRTGDFLHQRAMFCLLLFKLSHSPFEPLVPVPLRQEV